MPGLAVWSCLIYLTRINHCHPLPPRWPWRWIGPRSGATAAPKVPACFNKTSIQFFVDKLRRNERDGSTSSSSLHDSSSGSRHGPWQLPRLSSQRTSSRTKVTTRLLPLPGNQTSSSSLHDSTSGSRHDPLELKPRLSSTPRRTSSSYEPRSRLACCPFWANKQNHPAHQCEE